MAAALMAAGLVTACSGEQEQGSAADVDDPPTSEAGEATEEPAVREPIATGRQARVELRRALVTLVRAESGRFVVESLFGDQGGTVQSGSYRSSPPATDSQIQLSSGGPPRVMFSLRSVGNRTWMRVGPVDPADQEVQNWPCWVDFDDVVGAPGFPEEYAALADSVGPFPAAVSAASYGIGATAYADGVVEGTADLGSALGMASGRLIVELGVDLMGDTTVPARFLVEDGMLSAFSVEYADLPAAVATAGGDGDLADEVFGALDGAIIARFSDVGQPVDIRPPPDDEILDLAPGQDFEAGLEACGQA